MIFYLNILINLCLVFALWRISKRKPNIVLEHVIEKTSDKIKGKFEKTHIKAVIAEKMAERAFNLASAANLGVVALQKTLTRPIMMTKQQGTRNELARKEIDKIFSTEGNFDFLRPILSDEELDVLDSMEHEKNKAVNGHK